MVEYSEFLFARPTLLEGVARILDFGNTMQEYNTSLTGQQADFRALRSDWLQISADMRQSVEQFQGQIIPDGQIESAKETRTTQ